MEPHPMDYPNVFTHECAEQAEQIYKTLWKNGVVAPTPQPGQRLIRVAACFSEWLRGDNKTSQRFPPQYREISRMFQPGVIWLLWKYMGSGKVKATTYDGLVWLGKYWTWFPSPQHYLASHGQDD